MDVFSKLGFEKLTESVLGKRGSSGKAFCYESIFCGFSYFPIGLGKGFYDYARTKIKDLLARTDFGAEVCVKGWVRTRRGSKSVNFIALNDGSLPQAPSTSMAEA